MKIGELAQQSGLSASRIRFYEAQGLIPKVERLGNGYRRYSPQVLQTLHIIQSAQRAGFSLDELKLLLPNAVTGEYDQDELVTSLQGKVQEIEAMQRHLAESRARLLEVIDGILSRPEGMSCGANAERLLSAIKP
ncbi:MerR family transcriptional regulator [Pseudomonas sp. NPDC089534]|uniref:MerR family transcriptional regulator n=1 Tax=Pseudomonas sp. NPDC089534 TaxID=3364468 RepID=UPI00382E5410